MRVCLTVFISILFFAQALAQNVVNVAIKPLTPFIIVSDSSFKGYSIDLWNIISAKNNWKTKFVLYKKVKEVINAVQSHQVDVGIAGISITQERERRVDFSTPMFDAGLQVLVPVRPAFNPWSTFKNLLSPQLGFIALMILVSILVAGHVMWLLMRYQPNYPKGYFRGVTEGIWWAAMSFPQNSLGEKNPGSVIGRVIGLVWVFISVVLLANFTASVTANLTVQQIQGGIRGIADLPGKRVVTVSGTTAEAYLQNNSIQFRTTDNIENAIEKLKNNLTDAVVYDAPVLQYIASHDQNGHMTVVGDVFKPEYYGIAVPLGSKIRKQINETLTEMIANGELTQLKEHWFGGK